MLHEKMSTYICLRTTTMSQQSSQDCYDKNKISREQDVLYSVWRNPTAKDLHASVVVIVCTCVCTDGFIILKAIYNHSSAHNTVPNGTHHVLNGTHHLTLEYKRNLNKEFHSGSHTL